MGLKWGGGRGQIWRVGVGGGCWFINDQEDGIECILSKFTDDNQN